MILRSDVSCIPPKNNTTTDVTIISRVGKFSFNKYVVRINHHCHPFIHKIRMCR
jgi:hypothetical protein